MLFINASHSSATSIAAEISSCLSRQNCPGSLSLPEQHTRYTIGVFKELNAASNISTKCCSSGQPWYCNKENTVAQKAFFPMDHHNKKPACKIIVKIFLTNTKSVITFFVKVGPSGWGQGEKQLVNTMLQTNQEHIFFCNGMF